MLFTELRFVVFLAVVLAVHWALPPSAGRGRGRKVWLLLASYAFYACWDWRFLGLIGLSTLVDYVAALRMRTGSPRKWLWVSVTANLAVLGTFKYLGFFVDTAAALAGAVGLSVSASTLSLVLPVGISFYTFQTIGYTIDVYRGEQEPSRSLLDVALFVAFFPQLVAGPIVRARTFLPQLAEPRAWERVGVRACLTAVLLGFVKKACIADNLAVAVDAYYAAPAAYDRASAALAQVLWPVQVYCDFSGYTDMAIGCAGLLGYRLTRNFDFPFLSLHPGEFWQRWHVSLSTWLRDYLYVGLGGNRRGRLSTQRNVMACFLLGGLWHGASWPFVVWGGLHGAAVLVHRGYRRLVGPERRFGLPGRLLAHVAFYTWVCFVSVFFRAGIQERLAPLAPGLAGEGGFASAFAILGRTCGTVAAGRASLGTGLVAAFAALVAVHAISRQGTVGRWWAALPWWAFAALYGMALALASAFTASAYRPYVYFQF